MEKPGSHNERDDRQTPRPPRRRLPLGGAAAGAAAIVAFTLWAHFASGFPVFRSEVAAAPGWQQFRETYGIDEFGADGYFTRAVKNGYNLFYFTHQYGARFTRKSAGDKINSCASCHTAQDLGYGFVNSDRFDAKLGKRMAFEERVMRCYAGPMEGFIPTLYDPAIRDLRILARAIAHHLQLSEGTRKNGS
jgi:cytochrome c